MWIDKRQRKMEEEEEEHQPLKTHSSQSHSDAEKIMLICLQEQFSNLLFQIKYYNIFIGVKLWNIQTQTSRENDWDWRLKAAD